MSELLTERIHTFEAVYLRVSQRIKSVHAPIFLVGTHVYRKTCRPARLRRQETLHLCKVPVGEHVVAPFEVLVHHGA